MEKKRWSLEKKLSVILGLLGVVIIGLGVGIVILNFNQRNLGGVVTDDGDISQVDTESGQDILSFYDAEYMIFDYYDGIAMLSDSTTEEDIQKYITQTMEYIDKLYNNYDDSASRVNIIIAEVWFLQGFDSHVEEAIRIGKEIENESLSSDQRHLLYEFMGNAYRSLGNDATASQYYALSAKNEPIYDSELEDD